MQYLVTATGGPGFASPEETLAVLEQGILPTFDHLVKAQADGVIVAGGLPVGSRAFVFVMEAESNEELDDILRAIPAWGVLDWESTPLQTLAGRAHTEQVTVDSLRQA